MITFSCKKNESIVIGDGIVVTVLDIQGSRVELGIEHPDGTVVHRTALVEVGSCAAEAWESEE